jgi:hypothetical protein
MVSNIFYRKLLLELEVSNLKANNENHTNKLQELNKQLITEKGHQKQKESLATLEKF